MNDPICENCKAKNAFIYDHRENICTCTRCGVVHRNTRQTTNTRTFTESQHSTTVEPWQQPGSFVGASQHKRGGLATISTRLYAASLSRPQARMRNLLTKLERIVEKVGCCERIASRSKRIMFKVLNTSSLKRIKKDELLCSVALIFAAREARIQYTFREIADACENVERKEICRVYKKYERALAKVGTNTKKMDVEIVKFTPMIPRFASSLGLDFLKQKKVRLLFSKINGSSELSTLNPLTRLSVAIYTTMGKSKANCDAVSLACNVSVHTIQKSTDLVERSLA